MMVIMKTKTYDADKAAFEQWYLVEHLTLAEIGAKLGMSRQGVLYQMRKHCVDMRHGERFLVTCTGCGVKFEITRRRWKRARECFHDRSCMTSWRRWDRAKKKEMEKEHPKITAPADAEVSGWEAAGAEVRLEPDDALVAALCEGCPPVDPLLASAVGCEDDSCGSPHCTPDDRVLRENGLCPVCPPLEREKAREWAVQKEISELPVDPPTMDMFAAVQEMKSSPAGRALGKMFGFADGSDPCEGCPRAEDCPGECPKIGEAK